MLQWMTRRSCITAESKRNPTIAKKWTELKRLCVDLYGGTCSLYDFHHVGDKDSGLSSLISTYARRQTQITSIPQHILDELAKCLLVCSKCHRKITYKEQFTRATMGLIAHTNIKGRPPNVERLKLIYELHANGVTGTTLAKQFKCSRAAIYGNLKRAKEYIECGATERPLPTPANPTL